MTQSELTPIVLRLISVGATVTSSGVLRYRKGAVPPDERAAIAANLPLVTRALSASLTFARIVLDEARAEDEAQRVLVERRQREYDAEQRRHRLNVVASYEPRKARALALSGRWTAEQVEEWRTARADLMAKVRAANVFAGSLMAAGRVARVVRTSDGEVAVEVGGWRS